jgi:sucrose phosphorylase
VNTVSELFLQRVEQHLHIIYKDVELPLSITELAGQLITIILGDSPLRDPTPHTNRWDEQDIILIAYGDSIIKHDEGDQAVAKPVEAPLKTLHRFIKEQCDMQLNALHILPFYPYSSDEGFAVMNYVQVNESLGDWQDIKNIAKDVKLMADLVINHCSSRSVWFENFLNDLDPGKDYFKTASLTDDLSNVVRPRTSPLLNTVTTPSGEKHVWCTFSHDQVDFDFGNPEVLKEFISIIRHYLDNGVRLFRLDAVAPGVSGTKCERCNTGFWNLGENGCEKCGCNTDYAVGSGCNQETGQCTCLDGVVGQNCDRCPKDWVLVVNETRTGVLVSIYYIIDRSNHFQKIMNKKCGFFTATPMETTF